MRPGGKKADFFIDWLQEKKEKGERSCRANPDRKVTDDINFHLLPLARGGKRS